MRLSPGWRKLALTAHVAASVGWLGAVAAFLALALAGLASEGAVATGAYVGMDLAARYAIVPLAFAALATGLVQSLGTEWGLFRHYWVIAKLLVTLAATALLLLHLQPIGHLAAAVQERALAAGEQEGLRLRLVADAVAALVALLAATALSVYKPKGMTRRAQRQLAARQA